ncbi:hypothetical protein K504DRAFT_464246 [Pleomassaria siparia CBS 279.74]|uniref:Uncharacterized protein n=1 Tax=Pleomassaria siparia CBS 279.74 TaxID=1314801 RepID=A0A6G1KH42_9PLEO|nr:hypothetical protein K504DRAFT_464246 [Pleomassaria siparia CBS 279.74]
MAPTRSSGPGAKKKPRKRRFSATPKKSAPKPAAANQKEASKASRKERSREGRPSVRAVAAQAKGPEGRKRKAKEADLDELAVEKGAAPRFVHLAPSRKRIPQEIIDEWPEASPQLLEGIGAVLRDAKKTIVQGRGDARKIKEAEDGLNKLVRSLEQKLSTVKVPPMAKEFQFNVDKLTERNTQLGVEVTTVRHTSQLLKEQAQVAQLLFRKDEEQLSKLKKDVKEWRTEWKYQQKRVQLHPLLQDGENSENEGYKLDDISLKVSTPMDMSRVNAPESDMAPLVEQLRRSLGQMQGNQAEVDGMDEALRHTHAVLDDMMFKHASAQQYGAL